jgi:hypothetical protein
MGYLVGDLLPRSARGLLRLSNLKIGTKFRGTPALPSCSKACTLIPHPFIYGHLECSQGVGWPNCGGIDAKVLCVKTEQGKM